MLLVLVGIVALWIGLKVVKFLFKLFFVLVALAALGGAVWWFLAKASATP